MTRTPVNKIDMTTGEILARYPMVRVAAKANYIDYDCISRCINGRQKIAGGYRWEKADK